MPRSRIHLPNHLIHPGPVFAVLLLLSGLSCCESQEGAFHHFWLVLTWPPTFGRQNPPDFTIHGLWPVDAEGRTSTRPCRREGGADLGWFFRRSPLVPNLQRYWPSLQTGYSDIKFWRDEWFRHGRTQCIFAPDKYFEKVISLRIMAGDIVTALGHEGVMPGNIRGYSYGSFSRALRGVIGTDQVMLTCTENALRELKICVNRDATSFIECHGGEMSFASCPRICDFIFPQI